MLEVNRQGEKQKQEEEKDPFVEHFQEGLGVDVHAIARMEEKTRIVRNVQEAVRGVVPGEYLEKARRSEIDWSKDPAKDHHDWWSKDLWWWFVCATLFGSLILFTLLVVSLILTAKWTFIISLALFLLLLLWMLYCCFFPKNLPQEKVSSSPIIPRSSPDKKRDLLMLRETPKMEIRTATQVPGTTMFQPPQHQRAHNKLSKPTKHINAGAAVAPVMGDRSVFLPFPEPSGNNKQRRRTAPANYLQTPQEVAQERELLYLKATADPWRQYKIRDKQLRELAAAMPQNKDQSMKRILSRSS